jgi:hypothetical protein
MHENAIHGIERQSVTDGLVSLTVLNSTDDPVTEARCVPHCVRGAPFLPSTPKGTVAVPAKVPEPVACGGKSKSSGAKKFPWW